MELVPILSHCDWWGEAVAVYRYRLALDPHAEQHVPLGYGGLDLLHALVVVVVFAPVGGGSARRQYGRVPNGPRLAAARA
ncbi:hypothetical protein NSI01_53910 [Pimelobacter simplex]|nr:hypothetical protein NSI01_53910 [Pimelobacter simplex]